MKKTLLSLIILAGFGFSAQALGVPQKGNTYINNSNIDVLVSDWYYWYNDMPTGTTKDTVRKGEKATVETYMPFLSLNTEDTCAIQVTLIDSAGKTVNKTNILKLGKEIQQKTIVSDTITTYFYDAMIVKSDSVYLKGDTLYGVYEDVKGQNFFDGEKIPSDYTFSGIVPLEVYHNYYIYTAADDEKEQYFYDNEGESFVYGDKTLYYKGTKKKLVWDDYDIITSKDFFTLNDSLYNEGIVEFNSIYHIAEPYHLYTNQLTHFPFKPIQLSSDNPLFLEASDYLFSPEGYTIIINGMDQTNLISKYGRNVKIEDLGDFSSTPLVPNEETKQNGITYDMFGKKVNELKKNQIYIQNGKKFMVK